ncbi:MAG: methyltransferase domain-containing protein [Anaerolineales bacterium]|nr:methyltransferase domain-containing protein [Anaerolineales bacterium]
MNQTLRFSLIILIGLPLAFLIYHTLVRIIRHFYKFPIPEFLVGLIDNPLRRKIQPPDRTADWHGIEPGMTVLEVGPGSGTYTLAAGRRIGPEGKLITIDIESKVIARLQERLQAEGITNIDARTADVFNLPFEDGSFDAAYMIAVIGEIPAPERAVTEFQRVLKPDGTLAFSELFLDPDYPLPSTLERLARQHGFRLKRKLGNFFCYTLQFEKAPQIP